MSDAILLENLVKNYEKNQALKSVSLKVPKGSIFGLLGPNGAGKSTMINILAGTVIKTSGKAFIAGIDIDEDPKLAKYRIGVVPQEIVLDTFFTIREALELQAGYYGIKPKHRKTDEIITALGLSDKAESTARQLSGGMKRRFLVAKSMVHSPEILILDEPTAGVDITLREQLWDYVKELNNQGVTIILTTHYLEEAEELCDQIAFINHGQIVKCDNKNNLLAELGSKIITVETDQTITNLPNLLSRFNITETSDNKFTVQIEGGTPIGSILCDIVSSGVIIKDLTVEESDLEEVFKKIVSV